MHRNEKAPAVAATTERGPGVGKSIRHQNNIIPALTAATARRCSGCGISFRPRTTRHRECSQCHGYGQCRARVVATRRFFETLDRQRRKAVRS